MLREDVEELMLFQLGSKSSSSWGRLAGGTASSQAAVPIEDNYSPEVPQAVPGSCWQQTVGEE